MSGSDFAFSTIKPADCRKFCCPIKDGEYWANGLPVLIPTGIGDDSEIIEREGGGAIMNVEDQQTVLDALEKIQDQVHDKSWRAKIRDVAIKYRCSSIGESVYGEILSNYV